MSEIIEANEKPVLKTNMAEHPRPLYYFYLETDKKEDLLKYYEYLRELEDITKDKNQSIIQVFVNSTNETEGTQSLLSSCFRTNSFGADDIKWYGFSKINNSHHMVKLKTYKLPDQDELIELINDTKLIYEDKSVLIVNYNFAINS